MIGKDKANAIWILHQEGVKTSAIAKQLSVDRKTVKRIIDNEGVIFKKKRADKLVVDDEVIIKTFKKCQKWGERTHEELAKQGIKIAYSTLMKKINDLGLKDKDKNYSTPLPDSPGEEFQHDLSPYTIMIGEQKMKLQASLLYYRYCKINYLKFYPSFNRFNMKCFFYEAIQNLGYVPCQCIIDNTSLVIDRGSGINAVFNKEMVDFAKGFSFKWYAHAIKHSDRKAGVERGFYTITQNFLPGREFDSLEDLNAQAKEWCESRSKKMNKNKIIPKDCFEYEKDFMTKIVKGIGRPYRQYPRKIDQEGYILFGTNLYWSGLKRDSHTILLEYHDRIVVYQDKKQVFEHSLPAFGVRKEKFMPDGVTIPYRPKKITVLPKNEEKELRQSSLTNEYLNFALKTLGPQGRYQFIRQLYYLSKKLAPSLFAKTIERAIKYRIKNKNTLERIALYIMNKDEFVMPDLDFTLDDFNNCGEGEYGHEPDLTLYDKKWRGDE